MTLLGLSVADYYSSFACLSGCAVSVLLCTGAAWLFRAGGRSGLAKHSIADALMRIAAGAGLACTCARASVDCELADRRSVCRACGGEARSIDPALLAKELSRSEIRAQIRKLRRGAMRAGDLELPPSVVSLGDLQAFLAGKQPKVQMRRTDMAADLPEASQPGVFL